MGTDGSSGGQAGTEYAELFAQLDAPFAAHEVKSRNQGGRTLHYVNARTVANRLDTVVGRLNWRPSFREFQLHTGVHGVVCTLEVRLGGEWVAKQDAGGFREMTEKRRDGTFAVDHENTAKTGYSDSFKRAAAMWGVGRYLYGDGVPDHGGEPDGEGVAAPPPSAPRTGRGLYAWAKEQTERLGGRDVVKYLASWGKLHEFPDRMVDWSAEQAEAGHAAAMRKIAEHVAGNGVAAPPPRTEATDQAEAFTLEAQRKRLASAVARLASARKGVEVEPGDTVYYGTLSVIDTIIQRAEGWLIPDVDKCDDTKKLARYIEVAEGELERASA